jgi:hypothetical protein
METSLVATHVVDGYTLTTSYAEFWDALGKLLGSGRGLDPPSLRVAPVQHQKGKTLRIDFGALVIRNVAARMTPPIDIYMSGFHIVGRVEAEEEKNPWIILRSEFDLLYLNALENSRANAAWREKKRGVSVAYAGYQFVSNIARPGRNLPDCHARYCLNAMRPEKIERLYSEESEAWKALQAHGQPQVPCAPLDIVGLLYMIMHTHLGGIVEKGWPKKVREVVAKLPQFRLTSNQRAFCGEWYEHSHALEIRNAPPPLETAPEGFVVPATSKNGGWNVRVAGLEKTEAPHITINHHQKRYRLNLRTGRQMEGDESDWSDIPSEVLLAIATKKKEWCELWDRHYPHPNTQVGKSPWLAE